MASDFGPFANLPRFRVTGNERFQASCPTPAHPHGDRSRGLSGRICGTKIILKCFAGCETLEILRAMGLDWQALFLSHGTKGRGLDPIAWRRHGAAQGFRQWRTRRMIALAVELRTNDERTREIDKLLVEHNANLGNQGSLGAEQHKALICELAAIAHRQSWNDFCFETLRTGSDRDALEVYRNAKG